MVQSEKDFIQEISVLSSTDFDPFLKEFAQYLNLKVSKDVNQVLQFCGFYIISWKSLDKYYTKVLDLNLPQEKVSDKAK